MNTHETKTLVKYHSNGKILSRETNASWNHKTTS